MQLTSTIKQITPNGEWSNGQRVFNKYRILFANCDNLNFLAVGDFKGQVGESITYDKNEAHNTGKVVRENNFQQQKSYSAPKPTNAKEDTQTYIIRQSMIKAAIDFHALDAFEKPTQEQVIETARNFVNFINNG